MMNYITLDTMIQILVIGLCCQDLMIISVWRYLPFWNSCKPFLYLICYYQPEKVPKDKVKVLLKEHVSSRKPYYP